MERVKQSSHIEMKNACVHFLFAYKKKDVPLMMSFCDPDGSIYFKPLGENGMGHIGNLGRDLWSLLIECFPDLDNTIDAIATEDDSIKCQVLISGTQAKDFAGIVNKGKHFDSDYFFVFRLNENNKIEHIKIDWDHEDFIKQLS